MSSDILSLPAQPPEPPRTAPQRPAPDATSNATRLLCAGTYLDAAYRATVIRELLTDRSRVVAPSYGYDAVPVLAHALAARRLQRMRRAALGAGTVVTVFLTAVGVLSGFTATLVVLWLLWLTAYLRRVVTLQTLTGRLRRRTDGANAFDGSCPQRPELTAELVAKIDEEQSSDGSVIRYGGYKPFVGAGTQVRTWSTAELLIGARETVFDRDRRTGREPWEPDEVDEEPRRKEVVPFTVEEITSYVDAHMKANLRERERRTERIDGLAVARSTFTTEVRTRPGTPQGAGHWQDTYGSGRSYLCIRVGSWDQELVTTAFVGFDLKGNTLHTEFYSYVLAPIRASFHLVDRLPATLNGGLLLRVAWDTVRATPDVVLKPVLTRLRSWAPGLSAGQVEETLIEAARLPDTSEFRLGRYADSASGRGALLSIREMATSRRFHVFFQETDTVKYTQIVERELLQIVRDFLHEHHVDLAEHEARQTNILNNYGNNNNFVKGNNNNVNSGTQHGGRPSDGGQGAAS
ncbi:hypothetical protein [Streptomyces sp. CC219B]|uniref:hypothetical protein n=1 Tax=Streptomyces sp. CC219B TaxID=3044574 RepID=UPI0024A94DC3|nr:hypothetical protein [Streptomyces sp. CC219B]